MKVLGILFTLVILTLSNNLYASITLAEQYIQSKQYNEAIKELEGSIRFYSETRISYVNNPTLYLSYSQKLSYAYELAGDAHGNLNQSSIAADYYKKALYILKQISAKSDNQSLTERRKYLDQENRIYSKINNLSKGLPSVDTTVTTIYKTTTTLSSNNNNSNSTLNSLDLEKLSDSELAALLSKSTSTTTTINNSMNNGNSNDNDFLKSLLNSTTTTLDNSSLPKTFNDFLLNGDQSYNQKQWQDALVMYTQAELTIQASTSGKDIRILYYRMGRCHDELNQLSNAMSYFDKCVTLSAKFQDLEYLGLSQYRNGVILKYLGNLDAALASLLKAVTNLEKDATKRSIVGELYFNIANIYDMQNILDLALQYYDKSISVNQSIKEDNGIGVAWFYMGNIFARQGETAQAKDFFQMSYDILSKINSPNAAQAKIFLDQLNNN